MGQPGTPSSGYGSFQGRLSAHDMALNPNMTQQGGSSRSYETPTLHVTGTESYHPNMQGTPEGQGTLDNRTKEKKESFASALKKRLSRGVGKKRSQSADRAYSQSVREGSYLRPPGPNDQTTTVTYSVTVDDADERKTRSNSFGSSIKRIFKPTPKDKKDFNRGGSLNRAVSGPPGQDMARESSVPNQPTNAAGGAGISLGVQGYNRSRQTTPVPPTRSSPSNVQYSSRLS